MINLMVLSGLVLTICIITSKIFYKWGVPVLLVFIVIGMLFGSEGIGGIYFDDYNITYLLASIALVFIMFYGGFCTNWKKAKVISIPSIMLSTVGVAITAGLTGLFCYFVLKTSMLEGLLIGCVVASTDAASVISILRSRNLKLKNNIDTLVELESGSNDPTAYMLTSIVLVLITTSTSAGDGGISTGIISVVLRQIGFGVLVGLTLSSICVLILRRIEFEIEGLYPIFTVAAAILAYAISEMMGGNGYLSVFIAGIVIGNSKIPHKKSLDHFFDGLSWIMQIMLFFMLGLLSFPSQIKNVAFEGIAISLFLIFIGRPIAVFSILSWFKIPIKQQVFISWVGLRGAASLVFAIYAITKTPEIQNDIFHIIFFIAMFSVAIQGTLIPWVAKKLDLIYEEPVKNDNTKSIKNEIKDAIIEMHIEEDNKWVNKPLMDCEIPDEILIVMIKRNGKVIVPKGFTVIHANDILVIIRENNEFNFKEIQM
ncbi:MAG: potassium/proton antiporter [Cellulosilyticaceae bacterium]